MKEPTVVTVYNVVKWMSIRRWLRETFNKDDYTSNNYGPGEYTVTFVNPGDAILFKLRWGSQPAHKRDPSEPYYAPAGFARGRI